MTLANPSIVFGLRSRGGVPLYIHKTYLPAGLAPPTGLANLANV
jgi:hypothetical protein